MSCVKMSIDNTLNWLYHVPSFSVGMKAGTLWMKHCFRMVDYKNQPLTDTLIPSGSITRYPHFFMQSPPPPEAGLFFYCQSCLKRRTKAMTVEMSTMIGQPCTAGPSFMLPSWQQMTAVGASGKRLAGIDVSLGADLIHIRSNSHFFKQPAHSSFSYIRRQKKIITRIK